MTEISEFFMHSRFLTSCTKAFIKGPKLQFLCKGSRFKLYSAFKNVKNTSASLLENKT